VEYLEGRHLPSSLANVLVNDPSEDTIPMQDTQSETAIVLGDKSKIVVAYNDTGLTSLAFPSVMGLSRSVNGGATFADQGGLNHSSGDPVLARSSKTGTIFLSNVRADSAYVNPTPPPPILPSGLEKVNVFRSTNNGASFQDPVNGTPGFDPNVDAMDKPWIAVDNFPGPGYGNVYLVALDFVPQPAPVYFSLDILLTRSTDDGVTFGPSRGTLITSGDGASLIQGPNVTVGPDHAVYVSWWHETKNSQAEILMSKSTDGGVTFGDPVRVTKLNTPYFNGDLFLTDSSGQYSFRTNAFPQAVVNPVTGDIYVAYDDWGNAKGTDKGNIYFTESTDGGQKWSKPVQVNDDQTSNDQWFPALAVTPDGNHVGLFWYDRRLDPADWLIDRFGAIGTVSGHTVTFGTNFRITDVSFPPAYGQDPIALSPSYMGDYDQATADNNYFYTTWGDNRLGDAFFANQPDVRFAKIPVNQDDTASVALAVSSTAVPTTSALRQSDKGAANDSASLLARLLNSPPASVSGNFNVAPASIQGDALARDLPVAQSAMHMKVAAAHVPGSAMRPLTSALAIKALDLIFADQGDAAPSDGLTLAVIGS
jgi:hypothetical protein